MRFPFFGVPGPLLSIVALASVGCSAAENAQNEEATNHVAQAVTGPFQWKGYTWNPTTGGMAGVVPGDPSNVLIDASGYLHLKITKTGTKWTAAEIFTTTNLGFGTYQWQIAGPIDRMDHTVVLGLYPYGPQAGIGADGTNEIDTEFSFWNDELPNVNADWTVYPPTAAGTVWEDIFGFSLNGGSAATARMTWSRTSVIGTLMSGFQPLGSSANVIRTHTYSPANPATQIPQQAMPLGINLWCYKGVPASGQNVEVVIQDFQFIPEGSSSGSGGSGSSGAASAGGSGSSGAASAGGSGSSGAASAGASGSSGAASAGGSGGTLASTGGSAGASGAGSGDVSGATDAMSSGAASAGGSGSSGAASAGGSGNLGSGTPGSGALSTSGGRLAGSASSGDGAPAGNGSSKGGSGASSTRGGPSDGAGAGCSVSAGAGANPLTPHLMALLGLVAFARSVAKRRNGQPLPE